MDGKRWRRGFRLDISQAMRWRGGSMQRGWKLLGRGDDAYDVDNDHGRDHHLDQKGNQIQIERDYPSTVSRYRSDVFKIVFEIEKRYGSTSNRDKLLTVSASFSYFIFSSWKDKNESNLNISVFLTDWRNFISLIKSFKLVIALIKRVSFFGKFDARSWSSI